MSVKPRTHRQIADEIDRLKALKPVGPHVGSTSRTIQMIIETLEHGFDLTADEFSEMTDSDQFNIENALRWKNGQSRDRPSKGWGGLVK